MVLVLLVVVVLVVVLAVGGEEKRITMIMVVVVTRINLEDDFHKRVECVLLLLPGQTCIHTLYTHPSKSLNNCLQHESFHQDVKPEVITGGEVDFVNGRNPKVFPADKSRSSPILKIVICLC